MPQNERTYIAIDLKSYYASVECMERGLDPMQTNLVVADPSRTEKTICLAVSPALKAYGIPGRARLFEVVERVRQVNAERQRRAPDGRLTGRSADDLALKADASLAVDYLVAPPRMAKYIEVSMQIYGIYLKYVSPEDIHTYSIDEVLMDVTGYLETYRTTARELARAMILDVLHTTGITATAGIGSNLYLCKVAMDMMAKRVPPDENGVRIAQLDERSYRALLWEHRPLTDFWRVGRGYAKKLEEHGLYTMGDVARCSIGKPNEYYNEGLLYKLFGVNAELLIDHAWGWEPCRMADIKAYRPETNSISSGQVLQCPYPYDKARLVVREMAEAVALELLEKRIVTDQLTLTAPVSLFGLVMGKFLAAFLIFLCGAAVMLVYALFLAGMVSASGGEFGWAAFFGNFVGIILMGGVFVSAGIFISGLTENQMIAAIGSIGANIVLCLFDVISNFVNVDVIKDIISALSVFYKYQEFTYGIFSLKNVLFFISLIVLFNFLTMRTIERRRWS